MRNPGRVGTFARVLPLYLFALVLGGGLLAFSLFAGDGADGHGPIEGENPLQFLSLRTLTYFLFVFGGVGAVLSWSWSRSAPLVLLLSAVAGLAVGTLTTAIFSYVRRTESGERDNEQSFVGLTGRISLGIGQGGLGKVMVHRGDRSYELIARPFDPTAPDPSQWTSVVVVEMNRGTALVSPIDSIALQDFSPPSQLEGGR